MSTTSTLHAELSGEGGAILGAVTGINRTLIVRSQVHRRLRTSAVREESGTATGSSGTQAGTSRPSSVGERATLTISTFTTKLAGRAGRASTRWLAGRAGLLNRRRLVDCTAGGWRRTVDDGGIERKGPAQIRIRLRGLWETGRGILGTGKERASGLTGRDRVLSLADRMRWGIRVVPTKLRRVCRHGSVLGSVRRLDRSSRLSVGNEGERGVLLSGAGWLTILTPDRARLGLDRTNMGAIRTRGVEWGLRSGAGVLSVKSRSVSGLRRRRDRSEEARGRVGAARRIVLKHIIGRIVLSTIGRVPEERPLWDVGEGGQLLDGGRRALKEITHDLRIVGGVLSESLLGAVLTTAALIEPGLQEERSIKGKGPG